jgi:hypothetical protein
VREGIRNLVEQDKLFVTHAGNLVGSILGRPCQYPPILGQGHVQPWCAFVAELQHWQSGGGRRKLQAESSWSTGGSECVMVKLLSSLISLSSFRLGEAATP